MNASTALSEGLIQELKNVMRAPREAIRITSEKRLRGLLELMAPEYVQWGTIPGSKPLSVFLDEFRNESVLTLMKLNSRDRILRDIRTATLYVTANQLAPTGENPNRVKKTWLSEFHLENGEKVARQYRNSMSEKLLLTEKDYLHAVKRAIQQELGIEPDEQYLQPPYLFSMADFPNVMGEWNTARATEEDIRETSRYPGILTRNLLSHFMWVMPEEYYRPEGYHEEGTNHYFEWRMP